LITLLRGELEHGTKDFEESILVEVEYEIEIEELKRNHIRWM